jgi:hypothetical protein
VDGRRNEAVQRKRSSAVPLYFPFLFLLPTIVLLITFRYIPAFSAVYHSFSPEFKRVKPPTSHVASAWLERSSYGNPKSGGSRFITV